jgi:predicted small secreted protein
MNTRVSARSTQTTRAAIASQQALRHGIGRAAAMMCIGGVAVLIALSTAACRTTEGAGRDLEALGDNIADSAERNKP